jgi:hypothetical protein
MKRFLIAAALVTTGALLPGTDAKAAGFRDPGLAGTLGLVEQAQCRVRRERVVRPNGAVVYRTVRDCGRPSRGGDCRVVRERVERPNGAVVFRTRRVCG